MQPYFMPYLGYWQLMHAVDHFVFFDDVNFIKKGWVNRNQTADAQASHRFTVPLEKASQNALICDLKLADTSAWKMKWFKALKHQYGKAPHLEQSLSLLEQAFSSSKTIADLCWNSTMILKDALSLETEFHRSSIAFKALSHLERAERLAAITKACACETYINPPGGKSLYTKDEFKAHEVELQFIQPKLKPYYRGKGAIIPGLSIIDPLMWLGPEGTAELLEGYSFENISHG